MKDIGYIMEIKGKIIKLRTLKDSDAESIQINANDKAVVRYLSCLPFPYKLKDAKFFINLTKKNLEEKSAYDFGIEYDNKIIGMISLCHLDKKAKNSEVGYWLGKSYWRRGIAKEALALIINFGFNKLKLIRISAKVYEPNIASANLLEKFNFKREGILRKQAFKDNRLVDEYYYGLLKEEYETNLPLLFDKK